MSKNTIVNNLIANVEFVKECCFRNHMTLVRVDIPSHIYYALERHLYDLTPVPLRENNLVSHFDMERLCGVSISVNVHIDKPQYIMEMNSND